MLILGISAYYHDSAAALIRDGEIVAAAQEERFTRRKYDASFPQNAVRYCPEAAQIGLDAVDHVVFFEKPFIKFERLLETYVQFAPLGYRSFRMAMPLWIKEKLFQKNTLKTSLSELQPGVELKHDLLFSEHHLSHAASAFFPSPFAEALVLTMDGVGEWATTTAAIGRGNQLVIHKEIHFPHSLGLLYSAFTYYCGFRVNSGEYKLMGLAPYGEPRYADLIRDQLLDVKADGSFRLDQRYFAYCTGLTMTNRRFARLFGGPPRSPESALEQRHMDLAASIQLVTEEIVNFMKSVDPKPYHNHHGPFDPMFQRIIDDGTGHEFHVDHNAEWDKRARPMLEAFWHAKHCLRMMIGAVKELDEAPNTLPSGWAGVLSVFRMR